ncbi:MAG: GLUG motif-containing protein [Planctomycetota bacterium]
MCRARKSSLFGKITIFFVIFCFCIPVQGKYGGGTGEPNDPYLIYTAEQMNAIGADSNDWGKRFKLMADIDLGAYTGESFNIIGYRRFFDDEKSFNGVFDGNGHTISNFTYTCTDTHHIGLFGNVSGEIKNLGLIDPNIDAERGGGVYIGSLVGLLQDATITNCYVDGGSVTGAYLVGGLVGESYYGINIITNCYSTSSVIGYRNVGGLVGTNGGTISNSYSTCIVSGDWSVGGLVGHNSSRGTITNCCSRGSVLGETKVGGLVGNNSSRGTITNCCSRGSVLGETKVGGLTGGNSGNISNSYAESSVSGTAEVGGLVGINRRYKYVGKIINCYSTGIVLGETQVGGLVGNNEGDVKASFWDIETSGQLTSAGGTGLPTAEMQIISTFMDAGWDFVGETINGNEDIWFIPQQDYPHLWWQGMQVPLKLTPRKLNCRSKGNWVKARLTLPEDFTVEDVDANRPAVLHSFGFESYPLYVFVNKDKLVEIQADFERHALCSLAGDLPQTLTVVGFLTDGNIFMGTSTIRINHPGMKMIEELAWYWLNEDCVHPDFCDGIDVNRDSLVNLPDYALLLNSQVEFVGNE